MKILLHLFIYYILRGRETLDRYAIIGTKFIHNYGRQSPEAGMVAHPVTQVIGKQAIVDILDLSKVD